MNRLLKSPLFLVAVLAPLAEAQQRPHSLFEPGPVVIRGQIQNGQGSKVLYVNPEILGETEHVSYLDGEGRFEFRLDVLSAHDSAVRVGGRRVQLFVAPGDTIEIQADLADFTASLQFGGSRAATNRSLNAFREKFHAALVEQEFFQQKDTLPAAEFIAFANSFFSGLNREVDQIILEHQPDSRGEAWMRNYLRFRQVEDLVEYGSHHAEGLPEDFFEFDPELIRAGAHDLECSQFYDDVVSKYHVRHKLSRLEEFPRVMKGFYDQTESGLRTAFGFFDREMQNELAKSLFVTQIMTRFIESDHETADALFELYARIVPDRTSQSFIRRQIETKKAEQPLVTTLDQLAESEILGDVFRRIRSEHGGKVIYMDIWAVWCGACLNTFPYARKLAEDLRGTDAQPIYVCTNSDAERWAKDSKTHGLPGDASYFLTRAQSRELSRLFRYNGIPRYVIFDREGTIVDHHAKQPTSGAVKDELLEIAKK